MGSSPDHRGFSQGACNAVARSEHLPEEMVLSKIRVKSKR